MRVVRASLSNARLLDRGVVTVRHLDEPHSAQHGNIVIAEDFEDFVLFEDWNTLSET